MEFKQQHAIYLQIANHICERILRKEWCADKKISSIRDLAIEVAVNPNTVARSYDYLEAQGIIYTQRGVGYFVAPRANEKIILLKKARFLQEDAPLFFKTMQLLCISFSEIKDMHQQFKQNNNEVKK